MGLNISRRHLIALTAAAATATSVTAAATIYSWWRIPPAQNYVVLADEEILFVQALSATAYPAGSATPLNGKEAQIDRYFDQILANMSGNNPHLLKLLLHFLDNLPLTTHLTSFSQASTTTQQAIFNDWFSSDQYLLRNAIQSLVILLGMGYTTHPKIASKLAPFHRCGFGR